MTCCDAMVMVGDGRYAMVMVVDVNGYGRWVHECDVRCSVARALCGLRGCNAAPGSKYLQLWLNLNRI